MDFGSALAALEGIKTAAELSGAIGSWTSVLRAERRAGQEPYSVNKGALDQTFDATLARLRVVDETWWTGLLAKVGHAAVAPDLFRIASVQEWLELAQCQDDLKAIARTKLEGLREDDDARGRLVRAFMDATGENIARAQDAIAVCVAILVAGATAQLSQELKIFSDIEADRHQQTHEMLAETRDILRARSGASVLADIGQAELTRILRRRGIPGIDTLTEMEALLGRLLDNGDLAGARERLEPDVLFWLARLCASGEPPRLTDAERHLKRLRALDPARDVRIIEAWLTIGRRGLDAAIQHVRDIDDPDARSTLLAVLRLKSLELALEWLRERTAAGPDLLTGFGWRGAAILLAEHGSWEEAAAILARTSTRHRDECPDIAFVEGVLNAAMLLPSGWRRHVLKANVFHPGVVRQIREDHAAASHRVRALACFAEAIERLRKIDVGGRIEAAERWQLWLELSSPDASAHGTARAVVAQAMRDGSRAVRFVEPAWAFDVQSELEPLERHIAKQERFGGLEDAELHAKLTLLRWQGPPAELASFLERESPVLARKYERETLLGLQIEALAIAGQVERAASLLTAHAAELDGETHGQLTDLVRLRRGESVRKSREERYAADPSLENLLNLVAAIEAEGDLGSLRPHAERLFAEAPNTDNANRVVRCLSKAGTDEELLAFLRSADEIVRGDAALTAALAWTLLRLGSAREARGLNDGLLRKRGAPDDLRLAVNIALQTGEWERLSTLVERGWEERDKLPADILLRLARLAAESHRERALGLVAHCVAAAPNDPGILLAAYVLAVELGQEDDTAHGWLSRAAELSDENGPVKPVTLRELVHETMPAMAKQREALERALAENRIPLTAYAGMRRLPLAWVFLGQSAENRRQRDARRRVPLPIQFGGRNPVVISTDAVVSLDVSSVFILFDLGLLGSVIEGFKKVLLPPSTMELLLRERRRVRFHQPSLTRRATELRALLDQGALQILDEQPPPPADLAAEVGQDLAELLEAARRDGGTVVRPFPIHRPASLGEQEASLGEPPPPITDTRGFLQALLDAGLLDHETTAATLRLLERLDRGSKHTTGIDLEAPIYLDGLAVDYFHMAGVLTRIADLGLQLRVLPDLRAEQQALIDAEEGGQRLAERLDGLRRMLRDHIAYRRVGLLPMPREADDEQPFLEEIRTLRELFVDVSKCDAVCVDDRFAARHAGVTDRNGKVVPVVTTLDLLHSLRLTGRLADSEWLSALHGLRERAFVLVPGEADEFVRHLKAGRLNADGSVRETYELRTVRQYLAMLRARDVVRPDEIDLLGRLGLACIAALRGLWQDESLPAEKVCACSTWLWRFVLPSPLDWAAFGTPAERQEAFVRLVVLLLSLIPIFVARQSEYLAWLEQEVLAPLAQADPHLLDRIAAEMGERIRDWTEEFAQDAT